MNVNTSNVRVRFAPSPTGMMHLGNVRAALLNYIFAKKHNGTFILRIEDTDAERNFDQGAAQIISDLYWLGLEFDEGPHREGSYGPYFQSQRTQLYKEKLEDLWVKNHIYRCFCTVEELEKRRQRQIALKQPPRYDRTCFQLSEQQIQDNLEQNKPFIWRLKTTQDRTITITDLAHGKVSFNLKEISDLPLTRTDGSFTFVFANCVDDIAMKISHIIRGEDHLTNTAGQIVLYEAFEAPVPLFWHLPIICNALGKKLSKRDFGFSLDELRVAGFLPEALCNYLGIIGASFKDEIMSLQQLAHTYDFNNIHSTGHIRYDLEKLKWVNHKWISAYDDKQLVGLCLPFLTKAFAQAEHLSDERLLYLITMVKTDLTTLADVAQELRFCFEAPVYDAENLSFLPADQQETLAEVLKQTVDLITKPQEFVEQIKKIAQLQNISVKHVWWSIRLALTGSAEGLGIKELIEILGHEEAEKRLRSFTSKL